jgi:hypothetical protein
MRIAQCHISKSVHDFPFYRLYDLNPYHDVTAPCVFFGCYNEEDLKAILRHNGLIVIWWCGQDALDFQQWDLLTDKRVFYVTERLKVHEHLQSIGVSCRLNKCTNLADKAICTPKGDKVFAYVPASYPEYHGINVINIVRDAIPYEIIIGDGSIKQNEWRAGKCNEYYDQCFIGLVLSHFAGGGATVMELGLRGRKCVTNVIDIANVIRWKDPTDVISAITIESSTICETDSDLAILTLESMDLQNQFLNTEQYV